MSNALATATLLDAIRAAVLTAWGTMPISYGRPRTPITTVPYTIVYWETVVTSFTGLTATLMNTDQTNTFTIIGRFPFPSDPTQIIDLERVTQANALIAQLQAAAYFPVGGCGMFPLVTKVEASDLADPNVQAYELTITFVVRTQASHH